MIIYNHVNDEGTVLITRIRDQDGDIVNISTATVKTLTFLRPNGTTKLVTGSFNTDGTDGKIKYLTVQDDFTVDGDYQVQAYVVLSNGKWHSSKGRFSVESNL